MSKNAKWGKNTIFPSLYNTAICDEPCNDEPKNKNDDSEQCSDSPYLFTIVYAVYSFRLKSLIIENILTVNTGLSSRQLYYLLQSSSPGTP